MKPPASWGGAGVLFSGVQSCLLGAWFSSSAMLLKNIGSPAIYADTIIPLPPQEANLRQLKLESKLHDPQRLTRQPAFCVIQAQEEATFLGNMLRLLWGSKLMLGVQEALEPCRLDWQLLTSFCVIGVLFAARGIRDV